MVDFVGISIDEDKVLEISDPKAMYQRWRISILLNDGSTLVFYNNDKKYLEDVKKYILDKKEESKKKSRKKKKSEDVTFEKEHKGEWVDQADSEPTNEK